MNDSTFSSSLPYPKNNPSANLRVLRVLRASAVNLFSSHLAAHFAIAAPTSRAAAGHRQYSDSGGNPLRRRCTLRRSPSQPPTPPPLQRLPPVFPPTTPTAILHFANLLHVLHFYVFYSLLVTSSLSTQHFVLAFNSSLIPHYYEQKPLSIWRGVGVRFLKS